jgi:hypothetical protein
VSLTTTGGLAKPLNGGLSEALNNARAFGAKQTLKGKVHIAYEHPTGLSSI